jgi:transposase
MFYSNILKGGVTMKRIEINNAKEAKEIIKAEIKKTNEGRFQHRLHSILLICEGRRCAEIATLFKDGLRTIQYWAKRFNEDGINGLRDAVRPGRRACLSEEAKEVLKQDLRGSPREFGYLQNLWDGKLLSHHLKHRFNVKLKVRRCQVLFHELDFRRRKPRPVIAKADQEAQGGI